MFPIIMRVVTFLCASQLLIWAISISDLSISETVAEKIERVTEFVEMNPMMIENKLSSFVRERKWIEVINLSDRALVNSGTAFGSFKFWYYRALGECALLKIGECSQSCFKASLYAGDQYRSSIDKMEEFLSKFKFSKGEYKNAIPNENGLLI